MTISGLLGAIARVILNPLIVLGFVVAILYFFLGIYKFMTKAGDKDGRQEGKDAILWGLIGLFIMIGVFSIVKVILGTFGIDKDPSIQNNQYIKTLIN